MLSKWKVLVLLGVILWSVWQITSADAITDSEVGCVDCLEAE